MIDLDPGGDPFADAVAVNKETRWVTASTALMMSRLMPSGLLRGQRSPDTLQYVTNCLPAGVGLGTRLRRVHIFTNSNLLGTVEKVMINKY